MGDNSDKIKKWLKRDVSYSQLSSWEYNKEQWFKRYVLGEEEPSNTAMLFGNVVGDTLGLPHSMVPQLVSVPGIKEYEMHAKIGKIHLVGYADHYCPVEKILNENKTSQSEVRWTQKTVDEHKQLTMYALLLFLQEGTAPDDIKMFLNYIPVVLRGVRITLTTPPECITFETRRRKEDVIRYSAYIQKTRKEQLAYVKTKLVKTKLT